MSVSLILLLSEAVVGAVDCAGIDAVVVAIAVVGDGDDVAVAAVGAGAGDGYDDVDDNAIGSRLWAVVVVAADRDGVVGAVAADLVANAVADMPVTWPRQRHWQLSMLIHRQQPRWWTDASRCSKNDGCSQSVR